MYISSLFIIPSIKTYKSGRQNKPFAGRHLKPKTKLTIIIYNLKAKLKFPPGARFLKGKFLKCIDKNELPPILIK
jgi:hypothetical protein